MEKIHPVITTLIVIIFSITLSACGGHSSSQPQQYEEDIYKQAQASARAESINQDLAAALAKQPREQLATHVLNYKVGSGDVLQIDVFQVPELTKQVRVNGNGEIVMPLLGVIDVGGFSTAEIEQMLSSALAESYVRNPQVSIFVSEYQNQTITVMGALAQPGTFSINRPMSLLEVLAKSKGFTESAGNKIYVQSDNNNYVVDLDTLRTGDQTANLTLYGGDTVFVPISGTIFVEGGVNKPGAYKMKGDIGIFKAIALAGGTSTYSNEKLVQVYRKQDGEETIQTLNLNKIRDGEASDITLLDGDIVVVDINGFKQGFYGFFRGLGSIFTIGYGL